MAERTAELEVAVSDLHAQFDQRARAEEALRRSDARADKDRAQLAAIVTSSSDAIVAEDLDGAITAWNTGAERLYGYVAKDILGTLATRLTPPQDRANEVPQLVARLGRGE